MEIVYSDPKRDIEIQKEDKGYRTSETFIDDKWVKITYKIIDHTLFVNGKFSRKNGMAVMLNDKDEDIKALEKERVEALLRDFTHA